MMKPHECKRCDTTLILSEVSDTIHLGIVLLCIKCYDELREIEWMYKDLCK